MKKLKFKHELVQQGIMNHGVMDYDYEIITNNNSKKELIITFCKHEYTDDQELIIKVYYDNRMQSHHLLDIILEYISIDNKYGNEIAINVNYVLDHFAHEYNYIMDDGDFTIQKSSYDGYKLSHIDNNGNIHFNCIMTGDKIYITPDHNILRIYNCQTNLDYSEPRKVMIDQKSFIMSKKIELNTFINSIKKVIKDAKY